jgi:hypothetical protein
MTDTTRSGTSLGFATGSYILTCTWFTGQADFGDGDSDSNAMARFMRSSTTLTITWTLPR